MKRAHKSLTLLGGCEQNIINKRVPKEDKQTNIVDSIQFSDQAKIEKLKSSAFEAQANLFVNQNTKRKMYAKINSVQKTLSYRLNDPVAVNDRLIDISTNQIYEIKSINPDKKTIKVQADDAEYEVLQEPNTNSPTANKTIPKKSDLLNKLRQASITQKTGL